MKVSKLLIDYGFRFAVTFGVAYYIWDPKSDDEIRREVEAKFPPDHAKRRRNRDKFKELLLQQPGAVTEESKKQLDDVTSFASRPRW
ncbi:hypothetical protein Poli38472_001387 [Pythium oligandrum]|uniref:Uncharacterized protein n=1 Tax=Pythium oligandrum TaxID=41045 RepID=A0A8K1CSV6_PYTOL|nr:hypothetical protein Poli38472_001387 [Pythium oligandrum]|eukprot:TMW69231.1 hypothetical protein Poli38472_001387 [Pythium oligandrum]